MAEPSDEELMRRVQQDDLEAFGQIFDRYHVRLAAFLTRFLGGSAQAEDGAQEALWRVWETRRRYDPVRSFGTWIFVVAKNIALNQRRRAAILRCVSLVTLTNRPSETAPDETLFGIRDAVRDALQKLPDDQRLCVVLHTYEGFSYREVGDVIGCSEGAARVLGHRARQSLRKLLSPYFQDEECYVR